MREETLAVIAVKYDALEILDILDISNEELLEMFRDKVCEHIHMFSDLNEEDLYD